MGRRNANARAMAASGRWRRRCEAALRALLVALVAALLPAAYPARPGMEVMANRPDFTHVTSKAAARRLAARGALVQVYFFPRELGGPDDPLNIGYVPPEAAAALARATATLRQRGKRGLLDRMEVEPDYKGISIVPTRIRFRAWHSARAGSFEMAVEIW